MSAGSQLGIARTLSELKSHGIRLALDDFGTGFSNLSYLQEINVDTVKIDKRFVAPLPGDSSSAAIVNAIITMSHSFGIEVVAEGVETQGQQEMLERMGCDIIQGYHFARPLDRAMLLDFVSSRRGETAPIER